MRDDADRQNGLEIARVCASLTLPALLPPQDQTQDIKLPENFQSDGALGVANMTGKMLLALFPPDFPWFELDLSPEIRHDPGISEERKADIEGELFLREVQIAATLESADLIPKDNRRAGGFRTSKRSALQQIITTGECLEYLGPDYRLRSFRRDRYVTLRDSCGDVLYHTIVETIDPLSLKPKYLEKAHLDADELAEKPVHERMVEIYTNVAWQPVKRSWLIRQEVNGHIINETEEKISPYFCTPFDLVEGENYGRGYVERNLGDLRSLDNMELHRLNMLAAASKVLWILDNSSNVRNADLAKPSGSVIRGRVVDGKVVDIALLHADNIREYSMLTEGIASKKKSVGRAFMMESSVQPQGDRVTRYQVQRIAMELEGVLGGVYAPIAEMQQLPLLRRTVYQLTKDKLMQPMPRDAIQIKALTGIAALARASKASDVVDLVTAIQSLGPQAMRRINEGVLINVLARYKSIDEPNLIKSDEQLKQEEQQAIAAQAQMQANETAIQTAGNVVSSAAQAGMQQAMS